tara:strand:- start:391149 stop:392648 length:1500 start_codon:yes stop_codon:yes gene_type:complete
LNTLDWIAKWADYTPDKTALTSYDSNEKYSYATLDTYANRLTNKFAELGLEEGDRIAVLAQHSLAYIVLFSACQRMGIILVPLNYRLSTNEINKLIIDCIPSLLIYHPSYEEKIDTQVNHNIKTLTLDLIKYHYKKSIPITQSDYVIKEDNPLFIFYTSGTTGNPQGVIYTNKMLFWNSLNTSMQLGITFKDSTLNILPPYHTSGWNVFITPLLHKGAHIGMLEKFDAEKTLCLLALNETTLFMALPTMLQMMQQTQVFKEVNLSNLRYIISGGEEVSPEVINHWYEIKKVSIRPGYGLTEAGPSITSLHHDMAQLKPNSIGKSNFYLNIKIVNPLGKQVKTNEIGELCIKGNVVSPGYWNNSVKTNSKIKNGWLHTGDMVYKDQEGYLFLKGRKDDMYISGGENIYPQEIQTVLEQFKGIDKAIILSTKDPKWGRCGIAFVTTANKDILIEAIRAFLDKNLVGFKHPKYIFLMDEIPVTGLGKVSRKKLMAYFNSLKF